MEYGLIRVGAFTPSIQVADTAYNAARIREGIGLANKQEVKVLAFPSLCLTGCTAGDLFYQDSLLEGALDGLFEVVQETVKHEMLIFVGLPLKRFGRIYNTAAVISRGEILGFVPKAILSHDSECDDRRQFTPAPEENGYVSVRGREYPFGRKLLFSAKEFPALTVGCEIGDELWAAEPPSTRLALAGAALLVNLSATAETVERAEYRRALVVQQSARLNAGYLYCDAGDGESTTDLVFAGHNIIAENGRLLSESTLFENGLIFSEIDLSSLLYLRSRGMREGSADGYLTVGFSFPKVTTPLSRHYARTPFVPQSEKERNSRAELILTMQAKGLAKRIQHAQSKSLVLGVSGGLDSTLSLLVAVRSLTLLGRDKKDIAAVTMPCFGTSGRTYENAKKLTAALDIPLREINIKASVLQHFKDIGQDEENKNVTFENAQARERTQVLMDIANQTGGMVVGTGDLSELALGFATYNGDHMSMYGTNASVPKTLVRHLVSYEAERLGGNTGDVLADIADTPVSPELLPTKEGEIAQITEELIGPYILHDFFLYYFMRYGFSPKKILHIAKYAFSGTFSEAEIKKWLQLFFKRFFAQQFKRSCLPDGVKIGSVSLSPRGDFRMPSDAKSVLWLTELD